MRRPAIPWDTLDFFFTDERAVGPTDPLSNFGLADRELLAPQAIAAERVHRLRGEAADLAAEAARAAAELRQTASGERQVRLHHRHARQRPGLAYG